MLSKLFGEHGAKTVITLFHKPSIPASQRALVLLKQANATASATATEDQASGHETHNAEQRQEFELDVTEDPPTSDQLKNIIEYLGPQGAGKVVRNASDEADALSKLQSSRESFIRPLVVDWNGGKAVAGENESEILRLVREVNAGKKD